MASDDEDVPDSGAVFTFGKSRFLDNKFWIRDDAVIHVACGDEHSAVVTENGKLYTFGSNDWGQLGHGNTVQFPCPKLVKRLKPEKVKLVAAGRNHTIVSTESGSLFTFGCGSDGQLGHGDCKNSNVPKAIDSLRDQHYKMLACGSDFTAAVTAEGQLYTWGSNSEGQTGHGSDDHSIPIKVQLRGKAVSVACGYYHMAVATDDGTLYMCGENESGKLGLDESQLRDTTHLQKLFINEHFSAIACGGNHTAAVTANGKLFTFGQGDHGQLGHGSSCLELPSPKEVTSLGNIHVKYVACGESHTAVITKHGNLYTCGDGRHGKLGMGEDSSSNLFKLHKVTRFDGFTVQKVACGGCHTLVTAFKTEINEGTDSEAEAERDILAASVSSTKSLKDAVDGPVSYRNGLAATLPAGGTARNKRRQRNFESLGNSIGGSLPPISKSALPPLSRPLPVLDKEASKEKKIPVNPLDMSTLPEISQEMKATGRQEQKDESSADKETKTTKLSEQAKDPESSSGVSESEEEDEEERDEDTDKKKKDQPQVTKEQKEGVTKKDEESEESLTQDESESEEEETAHKNKTVASIKPIVSMAGKEKEEVEESEEEEESDDEEGEESGAEEAGQKPDKNEQLKIDRKKVEVTELEKRKDEEDDDDEESEEEESEEEEVEENKNMKEQKKTSKRSEAKEKETKADSKKKQSEEDTEEDDEKEEEEEKSEGVKEPKNVEKDKGAKEKAQSKENKDKKEKKKDVQDSDKKKADDKKGKNKDKKVKVEGKNSEGEEEREEEEEEEEEEGASKDNQKDKGKRDEKQEKSEGQKNKKGKKEDGSRKPETGKTKEKKSGICVVL